MIFLTYLNYFSVNKVPAWVDVKESAIRGGGGNGGEQVFLNLSSNAAERSENISVAAVVSARKIDLPWLPNGQGVVLPRRDEVGGSRSRNWPRGRPTKAAASCCRCGMTRMARGRRHVQRAKERTPPAQAHAGGALASSVTRGGRQRSGTTARVTASCGGAADGACLAHLFGFAGVPDPAGRPLPRRRHLQTLQGQHWKGLARAAARGSQ